MEILNRASGNLYAAANKFKELLIGYYLITPQLVRRRTLMLIEDGNCVLQGHEI